MSDSKDMKNKITGIDNINIITNGTLEELDSITNVNQIGSIIEKDTDNIISQITPLFMIINQRAKDYKDRVDILIKNGGNMDMEINYYGRSTTARDIAVKYRDY